MTNEEVSWLLELSIKEGKNDEFHALKDDMVGATMEEPGALVYEWSVGSDGSSVNIYERYASADATMTHMANFNERFGARFFDVMEPTGVTMYGSPDERVRGVFDPLGAVYMGSVGGFTR